MRAEIISIGDEIITGAILDTNTQYLCRELNELGVVPLFHSAVADEQSAIVEILRIASERADLLIITGGLGPTADDLTRQAIAEFLGVPLEFDEEILEKIHSMFARRNRLMPKSNEIQAFQPKGAIPIPNECGTAPGVDVCVPRVRKIAGLLDRFRIMAMPGVPSEMTEMWQHAARERVIEMRELLEGTRLFFKTHTIHCFGKGESEMEAMLPDIVNRNHSPRVGITANGGTITFRIFGEGRTEEECSAIMEPTRKLILEKLGNLVFGENGVLLQDVIAERLIRENKTLSVCECGTRGLLCEALYRAKNFLGGIVQKTGEIEQLVQAAKKRFSSDYVLVIGVYLKSGDVTIAFADADGISTETHPFAGNSAIIDDLFVKRTLNLMRLKKCQ